MGASGLSTAQYISMAIIPILFAITVHGVAHGWVAFKLGDNTACMLGRLTLNPLAHIDLIGTILVPALLLMTTGFIFGWAKPVPVITRNLRHPARDMALVAAAGPLANLAMMFIWGALLKVSVMLSVSDHWLATPLSVMSTIGIQINVVLMALNFLPIPPLDGSKVLMYFLPAQMSYQLSKMEPYGFFIILLLIMMGGFSLILQPIIYFFVGVLKMVFGL